MIIRRERIVRISPSPFLKQHPDLQWIVEFKPLNSSDSRSKLMRHDELATVFHCGELLG